MNAARRKLIDRAVDLMSQADALLDEARSDEQDYRDNMPESIGMGAKGDAADEAVQALESAREAIETAMDECSNARGESA